MSEFDNIISELVSNEISDWKSKAEFRKSNRSWLEKSRIIALKILKQLKEAGISQKELAEKINVTPQYVNKIAKGNENLTLETISKIEDALGITLIELNGYTKTLSNDFSEKEIGNYIKNKVFKNNILSNKKRVSI